jgi:A/G-specific adenine glycosylase
MPWKGEKDPYKIWISEIILQQTRVAQGLEYYKRFITSFPTVKHLANAPEQLVYKHWEGLGYYSRCKNLIETARYISKELKGIFPSTYEDILKLKGIGSYTASAIASFAYNIPTAVLDGNVYRVLSRYFGNSTPIDSSKGKKVFGALAEELIDKKVPGIYNQAIMDLGAEVCKPKQPTCDICPLSKQCIAFKKDKINILPVKEKKLIIKNRWLYYLVICYKGSYYVRKRTTKDIWQNLYEFILIETPKPHTVNKLISTPSFKQIMGKTPYSITNTSEVYIHKLSHQLIQGRFISIDISQPLLSEEYQLVTVKKLSKLPFSKFITTYLKDRNVQ